MHEHSGGGTRRLEREADRVLHPACSLVARSGNFGVVTVVKDHIDGQLYVLKEIDLTKLDDSVKQVRTSNSCRSASWLSTAILWLNRLQFTVSCRLH